MAKRRKKAVKVRRRRAPVALVVPKARRHEAPVLPVEAKVAVPDPEFASEWMDEQDLRRGKTWVPFGGSCEREFCDVKAKSGVVIGPCWPKGGVFVRLEDDSEIPYGDVTCVRHYEPRSLLRERDDDDLDEDEE